MTAASTCSKLGAQAPLQTELVAGRPGIGRDSVRILVHQPVGAIDIDVDVVLGCPSLLNGPEIRVRRLSFDNHDEIDRSAVRFIDRLGIGAGIGDPLNGPEDGLLGGMGKFDDLTTLMNHDDASFALGRVEQQRLKVPPVADVDIGNEWVFVQHDIFLQLKLRRDRF